MLGNGNRKIKNQQETNMRDTLSIGEPHPMAFSAFAYIKKHMTPIMIEAIASCAMAGNRGAEIAMGTWNRISSGEDVSDRYVLGLAWTMRELIDSVQSEGINDLKPVAEESANLLAAHADAIKETCQIDGYWENAKDESLYLDHVRLSSLLRGVAERCAK